MTPTAAEEQRERADDLEVDLASVRSENEALYESLVERRVQLDAAQRDLRAALRHLPRGLNG